VLTLTKRTKEVKWLIWGIPLFSIVGGLIIGAFILILTGKSPILVYKEMFLTSLGSFYGFSEVVVKFIPLLLCSLGVLVAFRMLFWNIGAEGQFYIGAIVSTGLALKLSHLSTCQLLPILFIGGFAGGALWAVMTAVLKAYLNTNEIITSLMLNYVAFYMVEYLVYGPWKDPSGYGFPLTPQIPQSAVLPTFCNTRIHIGLIVAFICWILIWYLFKTPWGYELKVIGYSPKSAEYIGIKTKRNILLALLIGGGLAGIAGMTEVCGLVYRLQHGFAPGYGYTAIIIAWLSRLNPLATVMVSFFFSILSVGAAGVEITFKLPASLINLIQGAIFLCMLTGEVFIDHFIVKK